LLVVCTSSSLTLLGVLTKQTTPAATSARAPPRRALALKIIETGIHVMTNGIEMTSVVGSSASGRIFMCGVEDGALYELVYQAKEGWLSGRAWLVNHSRVSFLWSILFSPFDDNIISLALDESRGFLYALTGYNTIILFHLPKGARTSAIDRVAQAFNLIKHCRQLCSASAAFLSGFQIVSIHPISATDPEDAHLVAVTSFGMRLYFAWDAEVPWRLPLVHVATPPWAVDASVERQDRRKSQGRPTVACVAYRAGLLAASLPSATVRASGEEDYLLCSARHPNLRGRDEVIKLRGRIWAAAPSKSAAQSSRTSQCEFGLRWKGLAGTTVEPPAEILVLTNENLYFVCSKAGAMSTG
jgi:nuclear pore complex protein Nup155